MRHRIGGPAIEQTYKGKNWFVYYENDLRHRIGGPAVKWLNGEEEYWVYGKKEK
jgi:hypothetical protein